MNLYPWLVNYYKNIIKKYHISKLHPIILINSPIGTGISNLILNICQWILCLYKNKEKYCNNCSSCLLIKNNVHPDFYFIKNSFRKKYIKINKIRNIIKCIYQMSQQGKEKIIYFQNINYLTPEASSSLLKTLEEPPKNTIFFLRTTNISKIDHTIKSRSIIYYINTLDENKNLFWLKKKNKNYKKKKILTALRINNNIPLITHKFLNTYLLNERKNFMLEIYNNTINKSNVNLIQLINTYHEDKIANWIICLILDVIKYKTYNSKKIINLDQIKLIKKIAKINNIKKLNKHIKSWIIYKRILFYSDYIDKKLIFTEQILLFSTLL
ncbi:DNA polymerase III subunit delta' C-terminal domain-containing protein [Buchnera aphidicola]|uniref:DNA polymerase III subunit delta' n=1 Tax=Buchnera aphidicola subsp. Cinara cedri (strain Cc) TaxID=372461 RepID=Q057L1_BUCCC|nr:DNA polymerase III subunit delta' C-terminal domain-containing protein [Buchnera aphidicola]ABJ90688.1 DNA polymerase III, d' subunit [Buchnera aphidicola BCc]